MNNRTWTSEEIEDAHTLSNAEFLAKYQDRTEHGLRFKRKKTRDRVQAQPSGAFLTIQSPPTEEEMELMFTALEEASDRRSDVSLTQESTTVTFREHKPIGIAFLGDIHAGNDGVDMRQLRKDLETIRDVEGLYVCGMGDYIDNYKPQAKSGSGLYHSLFPSPQEQLAYITSRLSIAKGKWLCLCEGNHDAWDAKWAGIDRLPGLAQHLETPYFTERGGTVFVQFNDVQYTILVKHDFRGKSQINKGSAQSRMFADFPQWANADVICLGHLHEPFMSQSLRKGEPVVYFRSGTYKIHDAWAEAAGYTPSYGVPMVILYPDEKRMVPFPGENFTEAVQYLRHVRSSM